VWPDDDYLKWTMPSDPSRQWDGQGNWWDTPTGDTYLRDNPNVAYNFYLRRLGFDMDDQSNFGRWRRGQYDQSHLDYLGALAVNPTLSYWRDWLPSQAPSMETMRQQFEQLTPNQRGERSANYGGPIRYLHW
jgi:hypothetical protein